MTSRTAARLQSSIDEAEDRAAPTLQGASDDAKPTHVAIIMDGNRRWARSRGRPAIYGHQQGANAVRRVVEACVEEGVGYLTLYAFSSENWNRAENEVNDLMNLLRFYLRREIATLKKSNVRVRFIGDRSVLPRDIQDLTEHAVAETAINTGVVVTIALNYGSRADIVRAARDLAGQVQSGALDLDDIDEDRFERMLTDGVPNPDLLIRTSGEQRLSNFLLWEMAYTEFVFMAVNWPEFDRVHFREALGEYARRERRYGASGG